MIIKNKKEYVIFNISGLAWIVNKENKNLIDRILKKKGQTMKLKDILAIQSIVENRATPYDLLESGYTYYSKSKDEYIDLLDLHITHFIRIFLKQVEENNDKMTYDRSYNSRLDKMRMTTQDLLNDIQYLRHDSDE